MIYLGADHGGFALKESIKQWLTEKKLLYTDLGAHTLEPEDDYPAYSFLVAEGVAEDPDKNCGILFCRSAAGMVIAANKVKGVRAVTPTTVETTVLAREKNHANVLGLSGDYMNEVQVKEILTAWLDTPFSSVVRHVRRVQAITDYENKHYQ